MDKKTLYLKNKIRKENKNLRNLKRKHSLEKRRIRKIK